MRYLVIFKEVRPDPVDADINGAERHRPGHVVLEQRHCPGHVVLDQRRRSLAWLVEGRNAGQDGQLLEQEYG